MVEDWRQDYNQRRPHSSLWMMTPAQPGTGYRAYLEALGEHPSTLYGLAPLETAALTNQTINNQRLSQPADP